MNFRTWLLRSSLLIPCSFITSTSTGVLHKNAPLRKGAAPADMYIYLLNYAGSSFDFSPSEFILTRYFSPNVKKFVNGICVADSRDGLKQNWSDARETYGTWSIPTNYQVFPSIQTGTVTIKHTAQTAAHGTLLVIAILTLKADQITEIFEVYTQIK